jgi:hypothetical protein
MKSIREIFRIGYGPSSSHTMGPRMAAVLFLERCLVQISMRRICMEAFLLQARGT